MHKLLIILIFLGELLFGQNIREIECRSWIGYHAIDNPRDILSIAQELNPSKGELAFDTIIRNGNHRYYYYHQVFEGNKVFGTSYKIHFDKERIYSVMNVTVDIIISSNWLSDAHVWWWEEGKVVPAYLKKEFNGHYDELVIQWQNGERREVLGAFFKESDTTIHVSVFEPDPLTSAEVEYGGDFSDYDDADSDALNNERVQRTVRASFINDFFVLENEVVKMVDVSGPNGFPVTRNDDQFHFTRSERSFEEVNAFYHITEFKDYLSELGFSDLMNYQIHVDANALDGMDNSLYSSSTNPPRLLFGEGGVDDAEDADVIIHEYGHAISDNAAPNTNNGFERKAIDEALADYLAATYSASFSDYNWGKIFDWDGNAGGWQGRRIDSEKRYPDDLNSNFYDNSEIWSSTLMQIHQDIGREETDEILIQSLYSYSSNMTMPQAARLFIQADSILNNGDNYNTILNRIAFRGILGWDTINSIQPPVSLELPVVLHENHVQIMTEGDLEVAWMDIRGRLIKREMLYVSNEVLLNYPDNIDVALLVIHQNGYTQTVKIVLAQ